MFQWTVPPGLPAGGADAAAGLPAAAAVAAVPPLAGEAAPELRVWLGAAEFGLLEPLLFAPPQAARKAADNPPSAVVPISRLRLILPHPRRSSAYRIEALPRWGHRSPRNCLTIRGQSAQPPNVRM